MRKSVLIAILFLFFVSFIPLNAQWARTYGGNEDDSARFIQQTSDGGYIVVGTTESLELYISSIWVLKLGTGGNIEWQRDYGKYGNGCFVQQTSDRGYIVLGSEKPDFGMSVIKLGPNGQTEWQKSYMGSHYGLGEYPQSIQQTIDGGYIVATYTESSFYGVDGSCWILKLSLSGDIEWQKLYGSNIPYNINPHFIKQTSDGGYIIAGKFSLWISILKLSSSGDIEWQRIYGGTYSDSDIAHSVQQTSDGGYIVAGTTCSFSFGAVNADYLIFKLNADGEIEWQKSYGGGKWDMAYSIQQTSDGGYIVAGEVTVYFTGAPQGTEEHDTLILKVDAYGEMEWQKRYGKMGDQYHDYDDTAYSIEQTSDDGYIVAGVTKSFGAGGEDALILKLDSAGDIDTSCASTGLSDIPYTIAVSDPNLVYTVIDTYAYNTSILLLDTNLFSQNFTGVTSLICTGVYKLTINARTGGTTDPSSGTYTHDTGTEVSIKAIPNSGYEFTGWTGDASGTTNPITITMDSDKSVTANFSAIPSDDEEEPEGCFIATAAYGSSLHPHIDILRDFRDQYLVTNKIGQTFVNFYYKYSPPIANFISKHKLLKIAVRIHLRPLISLSYLIVR